MNPIPTQESKVIALRLYRQFMAEHDPDLLPENIASLKQKYVDETSDELAVRTKRYNAAFAAFDVWMESFLGEMSIQIHGAKKTAFIAAEKFNSHAEESALQNIENSFA